MPPGFTGLRGAARHGVALRVVRGFGAGVWLIYLVIPLAPVVGHGHSVLYTAGAIALTVAFGAIFLALIMTWAGPPLRVERRGAERVFALLFAIAVAASIIYGSAAVTMWIFVSSAAAWTIKGQRRALRVLGVVVACYVVFGLTSHLNTENFLLNLLPLVLVGGVVIGFRRRMELARELTRARAEIERMAAAEERLRLARDMHDLTGQSLSMITLKSELAARLADRLPVGPERDRVRDEVEQIAAISRQTLHDIRQAISGYRRPTLAVEIITARSALESAGITAHDDAGLTLASGTFDAEAEAALAWCLREAVTNAVKHSSARNCHITLTESGDAVSLTVTDDGCGVIHPKTNGAGLRGMSERLSAVSGRLELRPGADGFRLVATVPAVVPDTAPARRGATVTT
jgi:two-component system, NarL family, sensor histidine kinase DesK